MKAIVCTGYGPPDVLQLRELDLPTPKPDEVRIRIHATTVTSSDCIVRSFNLPASKWLPARLVLGITKPRQPVLGLVLAGEIDTAGKDVTSFKEGEQVFGFDRFAFGAYAEYKCMPAGGVLASKPSNLNYEEAAAVQLARHLGADVTGACSTANLELVRSLGADTAIDYTQDDFTTSGGRYDLVFVAVGNRVKPPSRAECKKALVPGGRYVAVDQGRPKLLTEDLVLLKQLAEAGELKPVIDRCYPLEQIAEAHRYVDRGHKRGNVVITVFGTLRKEPEWPTNHANRQPPSP